MFDQIWKRIKQFFKIGAVAAVIGVTAFILQRMPYGFLIGYANAALVQYDARNCGKSPDAPICDSLRYLYTVGKFDHKQFSNTLYQNMDAEVEDSSSCDKYAVQLLNKYADEVQAWYLGEIKAKEWYRKYPDGQRSTLFFQIRNHMEFTVGRARENALAEFRESKTACSSQQANPKTVVDHFANNFQKAKVNEVVREAIWNRPIVDRPQRSMIAVRQKDTLANERRLLPLIEANVSVNVRKCPGINCRIVGGLLIGDRVCVFEDTVLGQQHTWLRVMAPAGSSVEADGWVWEGVLGNSPTMIEVEAEAAICVADAAGEG